MKEEIIMVKITNSTTVNITPDRPMYIGGLGNCNGKGNKVHI